MVGNYFLVLFLFVVGLRFCMNNYGQKSNVQVWSTTFCWFCLIYLCLNSFDWKSDGGLEVDYYADITYTLRIFIIWLPPLSMLFATE